jgi:hypothetical protein
LEVEHYLNCPLDLDEVELLETLEGAPWVREQRMHKVTA